LVVECTPLFHGVNLVRSLTTGFVGFRLLWDAAYLGLMGLTGLILTSRRLERLLLT
jgi:lipooligosaccharide transport system permease protein